MRALYLGILYASLVFGQLEPNTVTITATRNVLVQPDQVVFLVSVVSDGAPDLAAAGLPGAQLVSGAPGLQWTYTLAAPLTKTADTLARLTAAQAKLRLTFNIQGPQASPQLLASRQCLENDLIAEARAQAQKLSAAAGLSLGPIVALLEPLPPSLVAGIVPTQAIRTGDFSAGTTGDSASFLIGVLSSTPPTPALTCSLTVKFGLVRY